jgi:hypothetical protein
MGSLPVRSGRTSPIDLEGAPLRVQADALVFLSRPLAHVPDAVHGMGKLDQAPPALRPMPSVIEELPVDPQDVYRVRGLCSRGVLKHLVGVFAVVDAVDEVPARYAAGDEGIVRPFARPALADRLASDVIRIG